MTAVEGRERSKVTRSWATTAERRRALEWDLEEGSVEQEQEKNEEQAKGVEQEQEKDVEQEQEQE